MIFWKGATVQSVWNFMLDHRNVSTFRRCLVVLYYIHYSTVSTTVWMYVRKRNNWDGTSFSEKEDFPIWWHLMTPIVIIIKFQIWNWRGRNESNRSVRFCAEASLTAVSVIASRKLASKFPQNRNTKVKSKTFKNNRTSLAFPLKFLVELGKIAISMVLTFPRLPKKNRLTIFSLIFGDV